MHRYRTTAGLGPLKATATTTCQKCLKKGHYSYECKEGLQSRPYVSRASRTQQLRNPKLKPALKNVKLDEESTARAHSDIGSSRKSVTNADRDRPAISDLEPPAKRPRRSTSVSSASSVSTISTASSRSDRGRARPSRDSTPVAQTGDGPRSVARRSSNQRLLSPRPRHREPSASESTRSPTRFNLRSRRRRQRSVSHGRSLTPDSPSDDERGHHTRLTAKHDRRSRSPERSNRGSHVGQRPSLQRSDGQSKPYRQRSLSPYSRRLALTQAMNASR